MTNSSNVSVEKSAIQIFKTKDYSRFKFLGGNRAINKIHLARLKKSMEEEYLISPITVNAYGEIIDGQHRFTACQDLGLPIYYFTVTDYGLAQVQRFNSNQKDFSYDDFLAGYCDLGNEDYIITREFKTKYRLGITASILLLTGNFSGDAMANFKAGNFKIKDLKKADVFAQRLIDFSKYYTGTNRKYFVQACLKMWQHKNYDHAVMLQKLKYLSTRLVDCADRQGYLRLFNEIYNYKSRGDVLEF